MIKMNSRNQFTTDSKKIKRSPDGIRVVLFFYQWKKIQHLINSEAFYWLVEKIPNQVDVVGFTRQIFDMVQSALCLDGKVKKHFERCIETKNENSKAKNFYIDDIITKLGTIKNEKQPKEYATIIISMAPFEMYKWKCNSLEMKIFCAVEWSRGNIC